MIPASEQAKTAHALDLWATVTGRPHLSHSRILFIESMTLKAGAVQSVFCNDFVGECENHIKLQVCTKITDRYEQKLHKIIKQNPGEVTYVRMCPMHAKHHQVLGKGFLGC
jgi:hypothetical protein